MKTNIQFVQVASNLELESFIQRKIKTISEKYNNVLKADVFLKEEKGSPTKEKICEIRLSVPGPVVFASSKEQSFEAAIVETISDLKKQLNKRKGKQHSYL